MRRLNNASVLKRMIGLTLLKTSMACVAAQRVVDGVDIRFARTPRPIPELLKALLLSWILMPLRLLANHLVHRSETDRTKKSVTDDGVCVATGLSGQDWASRA